jgi:hypothetical protein
MACRFAFRTDTPPQVNRHRKQTSVPKIIIRFSFSCYNVDLLEYELCNLPDKNVVSYLCTGLRYGFDALVQSKKLQTKECKNNLSAMFACDVGLPAVADATPRLNVTDCDETGFPHSFYEWLVALHLEQRQLSCQPNRRG